MRLPRWISDRFRPAQFQRQAQAKAEDLIAVRGALAYAEAREQARIERRAGRGSEDRFWSRVAVEIARREGREDQIGATGADRFPGA